MVTTLTSLDDDMRRADAHPIVVTLGDIAETVVARLKDSREKTRDDRTPRAKFREASTPLREPNAPGMKRREAEKLEIVGKAPR